MNLASLDYDKNVLLSSNMSTFDGEYRLYIEKKYASFCNNDHYFIRLMALREKGYLECLGYIYFYIDFINKSSDFIGAYVKKEYRNMGLSSLLVSTWIELCLDNELIDLKSNKNQRKPFLLYLLKKNYFEIDDFDLYNRLSYTINICKRLNSDNKVLLIENSYYAQKFAGGKIAKSDNYEIITEPEPKVIPLDQVLLSKEYKLEDADAAYKRSLIIKNKFQG